MTPALTRLMRKILAVAILIAIPLVLWLVVVSPLLAEVTTRKAEIASLDDRLYRLRLAIARIPALRQRDQEMKLELEAQGGIWVDVRETAVSAKIEQVVRQAAGGGDAIVKTTSQLRAVTEQDFIVVKLRVSIDATMAAIERILGKVDTARPAIFVDSMAISAPANTNPADRPPMLSMDIEMSGYMRKLPP